MNMERGPKQKRNILAAIKKWFEDRPERITESEVEDHLSFTQWKTWSAIFEEIQDSRAKQGRPVPKKYSLRFGTSDTMVLVTCVRLSARGGAEMKRRHEMSEDEKQWSRRTSIDERRDDAYERGEKGVGATPPQYFRLVRGGRRRPVEQMQGELSPIEVKR